MGISTNVRKAYSEIDEFLELLSNEHRNKIPQKLRDFFKEEKDKEYKKGIDPKIPIKEQQLREETLGIIAWLNLQYWCEDENEKKRLREVYAKNEQVYKETLQVSFEPENIFKNRETVEKEETVQVEENQIAEYKESKLQGIVNKILNFFHLK